MLINPLLDHYIDTVTTDEPPLLRQLREETERSTQAGRMLCGPVEGKFLQFLVTLSRAQRCLEIGTFTGYSALYLAAGLSDTGRLWTCEINPHHAAIAQGYFNQSPDGHKITLVQGDATTILQEQLQAQTQAGPGPFDFIFLDADKRNYPLYYELIIPMLSVGGLLVVDNTLWRGEVTACLEEVEAQKAPPNAPSSAIVMAIHQLNHQARQDPRVETVMLSVRDGILLVRKK